MSGLISYASSDEEEEEQQQQQVDTVMVDQTKLEDTANVEPPIQVEKPKQSTTLPPQLPASQSQVLVAPEQNGTPEDAPLGPAPGPAAPPPLEDISTPQAQSAPGSPRTTLEQAIRELTMPRVPNFDIPPSPPGSPPPGPTAKFARFLELKKQNVHFNDKLASSSALRNPSLLSKLTEFAGFSEQDQYTTTLPSEVAVPTSFPKWAYADQLNKTQQDMLKKRETDIAKKGRREIEFVPAAAKSGSSSRAGTPSGKGGNKAGLVERVVGGDRSRPGSRFDDRPRSPGRRRSRSR